MTLMVTMDIIKRGNTCNPAIEELIKYFEKNNISEISFEDVIAHWKTLGQRDWAVWAYRNKNVFETLANYASSQQEVEEDTRVLNYLDTLNFIGYTVNDTLYATLDEAKVVRQQQLAALKEEIEPLVVCNLEVINANGDTTWHVVDLDSLDLPVNANIKVFDPITGRYSSFLTTQEALTFRNELIVQATDHLRNEARIYKTTQHPDFVNETVVEWLHDV